MIRLLISLCLFCVFTLSVHAQAPLDYRGPLDPVARSPHDPGGQVCTDTLLVPRDYPTIQAAIDGAKPLDTVLVLPGCYFENIDFKGKEIVVQSLKGASSTIIDGNNAGSVVTFASGEDRGSVLDGFSLIHGSGTNNLPTGICGGGIYCKGASPTIRNNIITDNKIFSPALVNTGVGGGIFCYQSDALITNNLIYRNETDCKGGALACGYSHLEIYNTSFVANEAVTGGAIYCSSESNLNIRNSIFWINSADKAREIAVRSESRVGIDYSNVGFGQSGIVVGDSGILYWGDNMLTAPPKFAVGPRGAYYLSQTAAGQAQDSPCVDAGDPDLVVSIGRTTRTDEVQDYWPVDLGFHFSR